MKPHHLQNSLLQTCLPIARALLFNFLLVPTLLSTAQEISNSKSGIDAIWLGTDGVDYAEEYFFHDKAVYDAKVVFIRATTPIKLSHNNRNNINYHKLEGGRQQVGENGKDGIPDSGDEGLIRYKIDRDRQYFWKWSDNYARTETARLLPLYTAPFRISELAFEQGVPVLGSIGSNGGPVTSRTDTYYRGQLDKSGDEWHTLAYGDDDGEILRKSTNFVDQAFYASDGKTVLLVVNPKTPCLAVRTTGTGQFYTTPPKTYWTPIIHDQSTFLSPGTAGTASVELRDIFGRNIFYRINGSTFLDSKTNRLTIPSTALANGTNLLEYYSAGFSQNIRRRPIILNPTFPSLTERHGDKLWENENAYRKILSRITRAPYLSHYSSYRNRGDFSGQDNWDVTAGRGERITSTFALKNAFVAKVEGVNFTRTGARKSHALYAKEMILEQSRTIDPIGFELNHSSDAIPNRELHYRGYYDSQPVLEAIFAYDLLIANYRSDQFGSGITPIEDLFIRDRFASFAYEAMQWSAGMTAQDAPGMWGGARMITATCIAMILPEYSTPYFGTSGFGTIQTTYPDCPYLNDKLTWRQALYDGTAKRSVYPNYRWSVGISDNGTESLIMDEAQIWGGRAYPFGTWLDKQAYFSSGLMGGYLGVWANMAKLWGGGRTDPRLEVLFRSAAAGTLIGAKDPFPQSPSRYSILLVLNSRWPQLGLQNRPWVKSLSSSDTSSDDKALQDAGVFGFAWYDDLFTPNNLRGL